MKNKIAVVFALTSLFLAGCSKPEVNVEAFVVTKDAGNVKLGLVTVSFLTDEQFKGRFRIPTRFYTNSSSSNLNAGRRIFQNGKFECTLIHIQNFIIHI